jgi:protoheme IX farnesyltransferase
MQSTSQPSYMLSNDRSSRGFRSLLLAAAILLFLLIVQGGVVRLMGAGDSCPDWPTCYGSLLPPAGGSASLQYLHRFATFLEILLVLAAVALAWKRYSRERWINRLLGIAVGLLFSQVGLGALDARLVASIRPRFTALHLGISLLILGLITVAVVVAFYRTEIPEQEIRPAFRSRFARLSLASLGIMLLLFVSGAVVAGSSSTQACVAWPFCGGASVTLSPAQWVSFFHWLVVGLGSLLIAAQFLLAWRSQRTQTPIIVATTAATVLFISQALLGSKLVSSFPAYLLVLHQATAVAVWVALTVQIACVGIAARSSEEERLEASEIQGRNGLAKDFLMLTKPIVVALLLVTTYAGMVIGGKAWPSLTVTFWTLLGGFMAAGGSGAINQYIDRFDDIKMQRTQKRPIPSGRLTAGEGLAFGVGMALASFYLMVSYVNFLAALLTLAGIIYYVLIYSIFLKKTTVQNIVIGGGAGAIPPLVGWAAATGSLNLPSLFLFAVVFMWTPPHFWALALVRRKDYARAGVPMLPVVRGEKETRWQILLYTIELVALTLLLPLFGLGGSLYFVGALMLGGWLLMAAWKVWRQGGNKVAWKMYRYSSMYLAFIFVVLMLDALVKLR